MDKRLLAALTFLAMGLACGASALVPKALRGAGADAPASALVGRSDAAPSQDPPQLRQDTPLVSTAADDLNLRVTPVVKAVRRAADSVVCIYLVDSRRGASAWNGDGSPRADGQGSGVILDAGGLVITNWHVVAAALDPRSPLRIVARLNDARQYEARVLSSSAEDDLALLQLDLGDDTVRPIVLGDASSLMIGETTIAIGNPQGLAYSVTSGVLSAMDRSITVRAPDGTLRRYTGLLQTDAAINQGNSGGALLDITGKLIGINNAMAAGSENIGFAIPVDTVQRVFRDVLLSSDNLANVWLGMRVSEDADGVLVAEVEPRGPADRAGVHKGDRILSVDGQPVATTLDYARRTLDAKPGKPLPLELRRGRRTLAAEPIALTSTARELVHRAGLEVETVTADDDPSLVAFATRAFYATQRRVRLLPGVVRVRVVHPGGGAEQLGLQPGDILLGCRIEDFWSSRDLPFISEQDLADKMRLFAGGVMPVYVLRGEEELQGPLAIAR